GVARTTGSDPRFGQALLAANLALAAVLGNGGAGVEVGGASASLGRREVPDLGSLFGGSKLPPLAGGTMGGGPGDAGVDGSGPRSGSSALGNGGAGDVAPNGGSGDGQDGAGLYGTAPASGSGAGLAGSAPTAEVGGRPEAGPEEVGLGNAEPRGRPAGQHGHVPIPLAAGALATGLAIGGADWLARRRTIGVVAGLRAAAGLGATVSRPVRGRRSLAAAGVAAVTVLALAIAPSRVPLKAGHDEVAAVSPIPSAGDLAPGSTGAGTGNGGGAGIGPGAGSGAASGAATASPATAGGALRGNAAGGGSGPGGTGRGGPGGGRTTGPGGGRTAASAGGAGASAAGGRTAGTAGPAGAGGAGTVTLGRDCPGGDQQDKNSSYSPPCIDFSGSNGGVTSKGVSAEAITVAMREPETFDVGQNNQGRITDTPADIKRSILAYVDYFNRVYQIYGRKVQVVFYKAKVPALAGVSGGYQEEANADALTVGQQIKAFADLTAAAPSYADALVRQGVIGLGTFHMSKSWYQARAPYAWANLPDCTWLAEQSIDYVVKRLGSSTAKWAGDPTMRTKPRAVGLVVPDSPWYQECADHAEARYKAAGYHFARRVNYPLDFNAESQTATNVVAQMKAAGVTTVMCMCDPLLPYFATPQANQQDYHPEWLVAGFGAVDTDIVGQFYDQGQWSHAFGMGVIGDLRSGYDSESYRAYKAVRNDEPAQLRDIAYYPILQFFVCAQMAGPDLTPKAFEAGCFAYPPHQGEIGLWKFGPGDYTAVSDAREIYWDPQATSPWNGKKGRYITTLGGNRFAGAWPPGEPAFPPSK
ncbi:MAG: hypothetical protein QOD57_4137, partial [Actinomycetota bacterium]|nr:hypothetical protein [Actinomycetota bacterium]